MKHSLKKVNKEGGKEIRLSLFLSNEELKAIEKIQLEDYNLVKEIKGDIDQVLLNLKLLSYWANVWEHKEQFKTMIADNVRRKRDASKNRKIKRSRNNRK